MKRKYLAMVLTVTMGTTLLAGCGGNDDSSSKAAETEAETAEVSEGEKTHITWFASDSGTGAQQALVDAFNESHDDIEVEWIVAPRGSDDCRNQMMADLSEGSSEYDVLQLDSCWAADFSDAGYLEEIDTKMMEAGLKVSDFNWGAIQADTYEAKLYALPLFPDFGALFFRSDIVNEEDAAKLISGDYTYEELMAMADKYAGQGGTTYGLAVQGDQYEGLICNINEWTANFSDIANGLSNFKEMAEADYTPDNTLSMAEADGNELLVSGQVVMLRGWQSAYGNLTEETVVHKDQVEAGTLPKDAGCCLGGWQLGINTNSQNKDAAFEFIRYAAADEGSIVYCSVSEQVPAYIPYLTDEKMLASNELMSKEGTQNSVNNTIPRPTVANYSELSAQLQASIHSYLTGDSDLDSTVVEVQSLLDEYGFKSVK